MRAVADCAGRAAGQRRADRQASTAQNAERPRSVRAPRISGQARGRLAPESAMAIPMGGDQVPRIVITHAVQDVDRWLKGKAERAAALPGAADVTDLVAVDGSNHAAVAFDLDDL